VCFGLVLGSLEWMERFHMRTAFRVGLSVWAVSGVFALDSVTAWADAAGDKVLAAMDEAMNRAQTQSFDLVGKSDL